MPIGFCSVHEKNGVIQTATIRTPDTIFDILYSPITKQYVVSIASWKDFQHSTAIQTTSNDDTPEIINDRKLVGSQFSKLGNYVSVYPNVDVP